MKRFAVLFLAISQFSYDTVALVLQNDSANSCYSPLSLYFAISLAGSGSATDHEHHNTVYFRDEWVDRFDVGKTKEDTFQLADGSDVTCDFMNMIYGSSHFSDGDSFTRSALQLKSNGSMVFVLPDEGIELQELLSDPDALRELFEGGTPSNGKVTWKIPKFEYASTFDLAETLKKLGVTSAFGENADFSGITDHTAFISSIIQNTHIAIDEKGVEASAFTKIDYSGAAMPDGQADMILDRPFIYGIFTSGGDLVFIGICGDPG